MGTDPAHKEFVESVKVGAFRRFRLLYISCPGDDLKWCVFVPFFLEQRGREGCVWMNPIPELFDFCGPSTGMLCV